MDEAETSDLFKLPDSGRISLSEIQGEFNKGNNLTDYYGVASGVPSSGTIKLTDFYGKEAGGGGPGGYAPYGIYQGNSGSNVTSTTNDYHYWSCRGQGAGDPYPFGPRFGVTALVSRGSYNDIANQIYKPATDGHTSKELDYYNQYQQIEILTTDGRYRYNGSWRIFTRQFLSLGERDIMEHSDQNAGKQIANATNRKQEWSIYLKAPTKDGLPDTVEIYKSS